METHPLNSILQYGHEANWQLTLCVQGEPPFASDTPCLLVDQKVDLNSIPPDFQIVISMSEVQDVIINARAQVVDIQPSQLLAAFNHYCLYDDFLHF